MKKKFLNAMNFRHACKLFDTSRGVSEDDQKYILETGRLSPSSFGIEHWRFLVVRDDSMKQKMQSACYDQPQVGTSSFIIITLAIKEPFLDPDSEYVTKMLKRFGFDDENYNRLKGFYGKYYQDIDPVDWSVSQCHIAVANMMTAAAFVGIDSCPIAAFDPEAVKELLNIDKEKYEVALVVPFGYRAKEPGDKHRLSFDEVVTFKD